MLPGEKAYRNYWNKCERSSKSRCFVLAAGRFSKVCNENCMPCMKIRKDLPVTETLFQNQACQKSCVAIRKFELRDTIETSILFCSRLDSMIECILDGLAEYGETVDTGRLSKFQGQKHISIESPSWQTSNIGHGSRQREDRKPAVSEHSFKSYLPAANRQLTTFFSERNIRLNAVVSKCKRTS